MARVLVVALTSVARVVFAPCAIHAAWVVCLVHMVCVAMLDGVAGGTRCGGGLARVLAIVDVSVAAV